MKRLNPVAQKITPQIAIEDYIRTSLAEAAEKLVLQVRAIDSLINQIDYLLEHRQPFRSGHVRCYFEMSQGIRRPQAVSRNWMRISRQWRDERIPRGHLSKRAKKARAFNQNHKLVRELLSLLQELMVLRANMITSVSAFGRGAKLRVKSSGGKAEKISSTIRAMLMDKANPSLTWFDHTREEPRDDDD